MVGPDPYFEWEQWTKKVRATERGRAAMIVIAHLEGWETLREMAGEGADVAVRDVIQDFLDLLEQLSFGQEKESS